jgi:hypothetical protein
VPRSLLRPAGFRWRQGVPIQPVDKPGAENIRREAHMLRNSRHDIEKIGGSEIDMQILELRRPIRSQQGLDASADGPAGSRARARDCEHAVPGMKFAIRQSPGDVREISVPSCPDSAANSSKRIEPCATCVRWPPAGGRAALNIGKGEVGCKSKCPMSTLQIIADAAADEPTARMVVSVRIRGLEARLPSGPGGASGSRWTGWTGWTSLMKEALVGLARICRSSRTPGANHRSSPLMLRQDPEARPVLRILQEMPPCSQSACVS